MESILFQNVQVLDAGSPWNGKKADVLVEMGRIKAISEPHTLAHSHAAAGGSLSPGWVDMRCQLSDPGYEWRENLDSLAAAALAGGFARILTQPNTSPAMDNAGQVRALLHRAAALPIHLHATGALSLGLQGKDLAEMYDMHQCGALAFTDGRKGTQDAGLLLRGLQYVHPFGGLVIDSPMDQLLAEECMVAEGVSAVRMGLKGLPAIAEQLMVDRDVRMLRHFQGRLHIGPVTTEEAVEAVRAAKAAGATFTAETSVLYLLLDASENEGFDAVTKVYPPLRERAAVEALRGAVADGTIDVVSSGHHPQGREEKTHDFVDADFGADTLETAFAALITGMREVPHELGQVVAALSHRPRAILGLPACSIVEGEEAELTHFDPHMQWIPQPGDIRSRSMYNPLIGKALWGRARGVYVKGRHHSIS